MQQASDSGTHIAEREIKFTVYADFNCPFCYALNERLLVLELAERIDFRAIQHAPSVSSKQASFEVLSELAREVAEVRRRAPSTTINLPMFRPNSGPAAALVAAVGRKDPTRAGELRQRIYRALWVDGLDISDAKILDSILGELMIEAPTRDAALDEELGQWQSEWDRNRDFDHNIPVLISDSGEAVIGFPLEPELDKFLQSGTLISDDALYGACEKEPIPRIMVLDTDVDSLRMLIEQMRDAQVEIMGSFAELVSSAVNLGMPDLVVVDTALIGGTDSADWWRDSTDSDLEIAVPVIFVSEDRSTQAEVAAFEAGAADYIGKPFHPRVLQARLNMHLQARRSQQLLNNMARIDALTSICNRREFDLRLMSEWGRGARTGKPLSLLMIDVDKFKEYNDHHGHLRGDDCLVAVAKVLESCMQRPGDLIARYGGEEFVALLPEADLEGALNVAEQCREAIFDANLPHVTSSVAPCVTVSIGVASMIPVHEHSSTLLIEQADINLYQAKQSGRNRVCSFED